MITTIDQAGRVVIPKAIREQVGLVAAVEITVEGDRIIITPPSVIPVRNQKGRLRLPVAGEPVSVENVREARLNAQR
jgi:AbrB family looped-hinge helix DNA binding protein